MTDLAMTSPSRAQIQRAPATAPTFAAGTRSRDVGPIATGRRVVLAEAGALRALADALADGHPEGLGEAFEAAVARLGATTGRVVVTGMGKSGHIARKIAATLASTGTPALFVHPAEASHGDLGMITAADTVLALSNSGETPELADLLTYSRRFGIALIAIVGRAPSTLAGAADLVLQLPRHPEACPMGLAPTTSTTLMLGLGDALAVALLESRGFSREDFAVFHPGGRLGDRLVRVERIMHRGDELPLVRPETPMAEALIEMTRKRLGCVGIVAQGAEGDELVGIVTDGDLRRRMSPALLSESAGAVMTREPKVIRPEALAAEAVALMNASGITVLFAVEGRRPVGVVHLHDCLRAGVA
jgi:arabinose-5-phosphate isomerase